MVEAALPASLPTASQTIGGQEVKFTHVGYARDIRAATVRERPGHLLTRVARERPEKRLPMSWSLLESGAYPTLRITDSRTKGGGSFR